MTNAEIRSTYCCKEQDALYCVLSLRVERTPPSCCIRPNPAVLLSWQHARCELQQLVRHIESLKNLCRTVLHGGVMPGGPPVAGLPSDQLHQEARMAARYDQGDAASSLDAEEAEGEAHGWLIARSASPFWLVAVVFALGCSPCFHTVSCIL